MTTQQVRSARPVEQVSRRDGPSRLMMAIQVGARSFADEGIPQVLDVLQERAGINAIHFAAYTYTRGTGGRQVPGWPLPDHGVQEHDEFIGGNFARSHAEYYRKTIIDA